MNGYLALSLLRNSVLRKILLPAAHAGFVGGAKLHGGKKGDQGDDECQGVFHDESLA